MRDIKVGNLVKLSSFTDEDEPAGLVIRVNNRTLPHVLTILIGDHEITTTEDEVHKI